MIVFCCVLPASNKARDDDDVLTGELGPVGLGFVTFCVLCLTGTDH